MQECATVATKAAPRMPTTLSDKKSDTASPRACYAENGYAIFSDLIPHVTIDRLLQRVEAELVPFRGTLPRHYGSQARNKLSENGLILNSVRNPHLIRRNRLPGFVDALRAIIFHPNLAGALETLNGDAVHVLAQTMLFSVCPETSVHIDSFGLETWPKGHAYTCWIALEDIRPEAGPPFVYPRQTDALVMEFPRSHPVWRDRNPSAAAENVFRAALGPRLAARNATRYTPDLKKGDAIVWSTLTPHGSNPAAAPDISRKAIQALYWPAGMEYGTYIEKRRERILPYNSQFSIREIKKAPLQKALRMALANLRSVAEFP